MKQEEFEEVFDGVVQKCKDVLINKAKEYATDDRLHNFKQAGKLQGLSQMQALRGMMAKHTISIYDMLNSGENYSMALWDEKIIDSMNYLILIKAILEDEGYTEDEPETLYGDSTPLTTVNRGDIPLSGIHAPTPVRN